MSDTALRRPLLEPGFWSEKLLMGQPLASYLRGLLTPVSWVYAWVAAQRIATTRPRHAPVPVVCVGNLTVGGAGNFHSRDH